MSAWYDGEVSNPGANTTIVETPALAVGGYVVTVAVHSTLATTVEFQHIDDEGTVLHKQKLGILSGQDNLLLSGNTNIPVSEGDKFRIRTTSAVSLGTVGASLFVY